MNTGEAALRDLPNQIASDFLAEGFITPAMGSYVKSLVQKRLDAALAVRATSELGAARLKQADYLRAGKKLADYLQAVHKIDIHPLKLVDLFQYELERDDAAAASGKGSEQPETSVLTQADLTRWEALARNIASELAIGDNAQVLTIIETGLARAAASRKGSECKLVRADLSGSKTDEQD